MSWSVIRTAKTTLPCQRLSSADPPDPAAAPEPDMPLVPAPPLVEPLPAGARESGPLRSSGPCPARAPELLSGGLDGGLGGVCAGAPPLPPPPDPDPIVAAPLTPGLVFGVGDSRASHALRAAASIIVAPIARQPGNAAAPDEGNACRDTAGRCTDARCDPYCVAVSWLDFSSFDVWVIRSPEADFAALGALISRKRRSHCAEPAYA